MPWSAITVDALRVGHYVQLDHPWFVHPFARNEFRIGSQREIDIIRRKRLTRLSVDVQRSIFPVASPLPTPADALASAREAAAAAKSMDPVAAAREKFGKRATALALRDDLRAVAERRRETVRECGETISMLLQRAPQAAQRVQALAGSLLASSQQGDAPLALSRTEVALSPLQRQASQAVQCGSIAAVASARLKLSDADRRLLTTAALLRGTDGAGALPEKPAPQAENKLDWERLRRILAQASARPAAGPAGPGVADAPADPIGQVLGAIASYQALMEHSRSPARVLAHLYRHRQDTHGAQALQALAAALTVYPPGSCVELSDQRTGIVIRVNGRERLRPVLRLHDPDGGTRDGDWFDLAVERGVSISRALHPEELEPAAREYLGLDVPSAPALWFGSKAGEPNEMVDLGGG